MKKLFSILSLSLFSFCVFAQDDGLTSAIVIEQIGKFHPLVLHFPAVLIPLTLIVMILGYIPNLEFWRKTTPYFIHASTVMAITAATLGLFLSANMGELEGTLKYHELFAYALCSWQALYSSYVLLSRPNFEQKATIPLFVFSIVAFLLLITTAHFGGETTHGELFIIFDYL